MKTEKTENTETYSPLQDNRLKLADIMQVMFLCALFSIFLDPCTGSYPCIGSFSTVSGAHFRRNSS
ncbi:hypothetical protein WN51_13158 [Melipona quadrifasciata]|uniref:Uncharacterized protein n=1 Tax=Melipona quadrifasciata TaxID=166423 RepID=A0A0M9A2Q6_9HYME|nr:hypothetical protein WN51_13158 [Melipona quadrifasciata]